MCRVTSSAPVDELGADIHGGESIFAIALARRRRLFQCASASKQDPAKILDMLLNYNRK